MEDIRGCSVIPGIFTVLSVVVYPADGTEEGPASSDHYVLGIHADNPHLVELLASRGMPASLAPGMVFEKTLQSLAVRVVVPWSAGAYELEATGFEQDLFHPHDNTFFHVAEDGPKCNGNGAGQNRRGCLVRMDFLTPRARDHYCFEPSDDHALGCGKLTAQAGSPVAGFFGASDRTAHNAWDHEPLQRAWFVLQ